MLRGGALFAPSQRRPRFCGRSEFEHFVITKAQVVIQMVELLLLFLHTLSVFDDYLQLYKKYVLG